MAVDLLTVAIDVALAVLTSLYLVKLLHEEFVASRRGPKSLVSSYAASQAEKRSLLHQKVCSA